MIKDELSTDLLVELYDTYQDMRSGKLTLTRVYILIAICGLGVFGLLGVSMLFAIQFVIAGVYFACALLCYLLLRFRRRRFIARHFDWLAVLTSHLLTIVAVSLNVYLYGYAGGSQLFIFAMVAIFYIITLDKLKKRFWPILGVFACDLLGFWMVTWIDYETPMQIKTSNVFATVTFIISTCLALFVSIAPVLISKLFSIDAIERLNYMEDKRVNFSADEFYGCMGKRAADYSIAKSDGENFKDLNIAFFEVVIGQKRSNVVYKVNDFYFSRILKEFATLLRSYFTLAHYRIRSDANTFLVIFPSAHEDAYKILLNVMGAFEQKIRAENETLDVYLRIIAQHYEELDTRKRPRLLLDCINELSRVRSDSRVLGREFLHLGIKSKEQHKREAL